MCLVNFKFKVVLIFLCLDDSRPHTIPTPSGPTPLQCICQSLGLQVRRGIPRYSSNELPDKITMNSYTIFLFSLLSICLSVALYVYLFLSFSEVTQKPIFCVTAEKTETSQEFDWQLSLSLSPPLSISHTDTHTHAPHTPPFYHPKWTSVSAYYTDTAYCHTGTWGSQKSTFYEKTPQFLGSAFWKGSFNSLSVYWVQFMY